MVESGHTSHAHTHTQDSHSTDKQLPPSGANVTLWPCVSFPCRTESALQGSHQRLFLQPLTWIREKKTGREQDPMVGCLLPTHSVSLPL